MTSNNAGLGRNGDSRSQSEVIQSGVVRTLRFLIPQHFEADTGDELATVVRAWQLQANDPADDSQVYSEERELVDYDYRIAPDGKHHLWIWYAE